MNLYSYIFFGLVGLLLFLFAWLAGNARTSRTTATHASDLEERERRHVTYLPQIRQALAKTDYDFLSGKALGGVQRRVRRERRDVALAYLAALRGDFQNLLRMARIIAVLSPEVAAVQELERLRLTVQFTWRYELVRLELLAGFAALPQLDGLSNLISGLSVRIETAMKNLGERAALAAELASSLDRRGTNFA